MSKMLLRTQAAAPRILAFAAWARIFFPLVHGTVPGKTLSPKDGENLRENSSPARPGGLALAVCQPRGYRFPAERLDYPCAQ